MSGKCRVPTAKGPEIRGENRTVHAISWVDSTLSTSNMGVSTKIKPYETAIEGGTQTQACIRADQILAKQQMSHRPGFPVRQK